MKILLKILLFLVCINHAAAQDLHVDVDLQGMRPFGFVRITDMKDVRSQPAANINYDDIDGSAFWSNNWNAAMLYTEAYKIMLPEAKLNCYSGEIFYKNDTGQVRAISPGAINKIVFYKGSDTSVTIATFLYLQKAGESANHFAELLNEGNTLLLKLRDVIVVERPYDVIQGKHVYGFTGKADYYLFHDNNPIKLQSLNREAFFAGIRPTAGDLDWLKKTNNKLKNEKDFVAFLDYYNKQQSAPANAR